MSTPKFDTDYYQGVIARNGYDPSLFEGFDNELESLDETDLTRLFLCHQGLYEFRDADTAKAVVTGFGLSGVPHLGTLSQMNRAGILNDAGYQTEMVLGDLDAYNGKRTSFETVRKLAISYARFIEETGLLDNDTSTIRNQFDYPEVLRTSFMIGRYASNDLFTRSQEDLHEYYAQSGKVDAEMTYPRMLSLNLMIADFIHLGQSYPNVLVMLGIDEHQYVRAAQELARRIDPEDTAFSPVVISCIYTPIISGLGGYPKMSKSFPDSGISLDMPRARIEQAIQTEPDSFSQPNESVIYQIACGIGLSDGATLSEVEQAARAKNSDWRDVKHQVIGRVAHFADIWNKVSND